jgi:hypothetical protein
MPIIENRQDFEPSADARKNWLATRKKTYPYALPGFYNTIDNQKDSGWFILAACIEAAAIILTLYGGISKSMTRGFSHGGVIYLAGSIILIFMFFICDFVGIYFYHRNVGERCLIRNKIRLETDPGAQEGLRNDLSKGVFFKVMGVILIVISALLKIGAIFLLGSFALFFYVIMAILYLIVIYIHLAHTGYYLAETSTERIFKKQHNEWSNGRKNATNINLPGGHVKYEITIPKPITTFESEIKLKTENNIIQGGNHHYIRLEEEKKVDEEKIIYVYILEATGLLIDDDINSLTRGQTPQAGNIIAEACLRHQLFYH